MSWAGILAGAVEGGANAAGGMARGYIEDERKLDVAAQLSKMEEAKQLRINEASVRMSADSQIRVNEATATSAAARKRAEAEAERERVRGVLAGSEGAGAGGPTEQMIAAREAALKAGDMELVKQLDERIASGSKTLAPYAQLYQDGKLVATNDGYDKTKAAVDAAAAKGKGKSVFERMSEADKEAHKVLGQQIRDLDQEINKAKLTGTADPVAVTELTKKLNDMRFQQDAIMKPYRKAGEGDPLGLRGDKPPKTGPAAEAPAPASKTPCAPAKPAAASSGVLSSVAPDPAGPGTDKSWVLNKLMGKFDGPEKLLEIARTNANPALRRAAQELYDEYRAREAAVDTSAPGMAM